MEKETDEQGNTTYRYPKCPACGSLYAVIVITGKFKKHLAVAPPTIHLPGQN